jgi:mRNA interferase MazF
MIKEGDIVLFRFPNTNQLLGKLRPALVLRENPGPYNDWLICMISTRLSQQIDGLDEIISSVDNDFKESGLKSSNLIRVSRLAVVDQDVLLGVIGKIGFSRLRGIRRVISDWISAD